MFAEPRTEVCISYSECFRPYLKLRDPINICDTNRKLSDTAATSIKTTSKPSAFPSILRAKKSTVQTLTEADVQKGAVIAETCPECGRKEMTFYTQQLRSADEGSTVFYSCECGHKFTVNN